MKSTKSIILILLLAASTLFNSCSSDDNDNLLEESLEGTFLAAPIVTEKFVNGIPQQIEPADPITNDSFLRITFNADNTLLFLRPLDLREGGGNIITLLDPGRYSINGDTLTVISDEEDSQQDYILSENRDSFTQVTDIETEYKGDILRFITTVMYDRE